MFSMSCGSVAYIPVPDAIRTSDTCTFLSNPPVANIADSTGFQITDCTYRYYNPYLAEGGWEEGRVGGWEGGREGGWEGGRVGGWEGGRVGGRGKEVSK
jgi:hypothetical protein